VPDREPGVEPGVTPGVEPGVEPGVTPGVEPAGALSVWAAIVSEAAGESRLWADVTLPPGAREEVAVFSPLGDPRYALGLETIYEGYLVHYGRPRLFAPTDRDTAILLGDYLYAHGLVRVAEHEDVVAVANLAELISLCSLLQGEQKGGAGPLWAAHAALLAEGGLDEARAALRDLDDPAPLLALARAAAGADAVAAALVAHECRVR
jgi:hypothetical protein